MKPSPGKIKGPRVPKPGPAPESFICPVCFRLYPKRSVDPDYPLCGDCGSEAMDIELIPLGRFLSESSLNELEQTQKKWNEATEFYESYKQEKAARISRVIRLKQNEEPADSPSSLRIPKA